MSTRAGVREDAGLSSGDKGKKGPSPVSNRKQWIVSEKVRPSGSLIKKKKRPWDGR